MATAAQLAKAIAKTEKAILATPHINKAEAFQSLAQTKANLKAQFKLKGVLLGFAILFAAAGSSAQTPNTEGQKLEQKQAKKDVCYGAVATTAYHTGRNGEQFRIYVSQTGRAFIVRTSKAGKQYRDYSPKACKALNVADWVTK